MHDLGQKVAALRKVALFTGIDDEEINTLAQEVAVKSFKAADELVREGALGSDVFFIVEGSCEVLRGGKRVTSLGPGQMFGEMAVISAEPRTATVTATTPVVAYVLSAWGFRSAVHARPELAMRIMKTLAARLRKAEEELAGYKGK